MRGQKAPVWSAEFQDTENWREKCARAEEDARGRGEYFSSLLEQVAWSLGASWSQTAVRVLLPNLAPSLLASWIFAFVISFDEVIVTSFIAGPIHTVPKKMYNELLLGVTPTITAVATLLIIATLCVMAVAQKLRKSGEVLQS